MITTADPSSSVNNTPAQAVIAPADNDPKAPDAAHPVFPRPDKRSIGEQAFHALTYKAVGYFANLGLSLVVWDFFLTGKGKPILDGIAKGAAKGLTAAGMNEKWAIGGAQTAAEMGCSPLGGHIIMIPVKVLEDHARYLTHEFNKLLDPNYQYKDLKVGWNTPEDQLPKMADEPSDQSWSQIIIRRSLGWAAVTASGLALNKFQGGRFQDMLQDTTLKLGNTAVKATGNEALQRIIGSDTGQRYMKLAALDVYFTVITSAITECTKNLFGNKKNGDHHAEDTSAPETPVVAAAPAESDKTDTPSFAERHPKRERADIIPSTNHVHALSQQPEHAPGLSV